MHSERHWDNFSVDVALHIPSMGPASLTPHFLFTNFPTIHMCPMDVANITEKQNYSCPVYKTPDRRGILSTTGHSTNFVLDTRVPIGNDAAHWTKRGVALLLSLME